MLNTLAAHDAAPALVSAMTAALDGAQWPGDVVVSLLSREEDGSASADLTSTVAAYLSDETRRPLTDHVIVQSASILPYTVEAIITTFSGPDGGVVLENARQSLASYVESSQRLGRDITISGLHAALHVEGVQNVQLLSPTADIVVDRTQAPFCTSQVVTYAGIGE